MVLLPIMSHPSVKCPVLRVGYVLERWLSELFTAEETVVCKWLGSISGGKDAS